MIKASRPYSQGNVTHNFCTTICDHGLTKSQSSKQLQIFEIVKSDIYGKIGQGKGK